jgi:2,3-bisphosphoglycerate-dependent phosphoglycerate mutase
VPSTLILLRHGQSVWNLKNLSTGWIDVDLTELGAEEARRSGSDLARAGVLPDVVHTSVQVRAIRTAELALAECARSWIDVRRSWRLNERHYGDLQGKNKRDSAAKYGAEQFNLWRRSFDVRPPPLNPMKHKQRWGYDDRYASLPRDLLPRSECLADVIERMLPWWYDAIVPDLRRGATVMVAAHGNSLRGLVMHLDGMTPDAVVGLNLPTGEPLVYELDDDLRPTARKGPGGVRGRYLDPERAVAAADAVKRQAG